MSYLLVFELAGPPVPWARTTTHQGRRLTPKRQREYQRALQWAAIAAMRDRTGWPLDARYALEVDAYVTPKQRGDLDNIAKQVGDAGNRVLWADDRRIDEITIRRHVDRDRPRLVVRVRTLDPADETDRIMHGGDVR